MDRNFDLVESLKKALKPAHPQVVNDLLNALDGYHSWQLLMAQDCRAEFDSSEYLVKAALVEDLARAIRESVE